MWSTFISSKLFIWIIKPQSLCCSSHECTWWYYQAVALNFTQTEVYLQIKAVLCCRPRGHQRASYDQHVFMETPLTEPLNLLPPLTRFMWGQIQHHFTSTTRLQSLEHICSYRYTGALVVSLFQQGCVKLNKYDIYVVTKYFFFK